MNIALPAILLFVLLLPGFIARSRFKRIERTSLDYAPFGEVVASGLIWAVLLHAVWLAMAWLAAGRVLELRTLTGLMSTSPALQDEAIRRVQAEQWSVLTYFSTILVVPYLVAPLGTALISRYHLDRGRLARFFKFHDAPWYYLFTAADASEPPDMVIVSAIVDIGKRPYLFQGVLSEYFLTPDGALDRLVLENVYRRPLERDKGWTPAATQPPAEPTSSAAATSNAAPVDPPAGAAEQAGPSTERFYRIDGTYFVLRYAEIVTLNVWHVVLDEVEDWPAVVAAVDAR